MEIKLNIKKAIKLANSKTATVQDVFQMIAKDVEQFTKQREDFYFQDFRSQYENGSIIPDSDTADIHAEQIYGNIEADIKSFAEKYADQAVDAVLDAKNEGKFTSKMGATNLLILLTAMKDAYVE